VVGIAARVGAAVLTGVPAIEKYQQQTRSGDGRDKASALLDLAVDELRAASLAAGRDLSLNPRVIDVLKRLTNDVVELHNALAAASHDGV